MSPSGFQRLIGNRPTCPRARIWRRQAAPYRAIRGDITSRARLSVCGTAPSAPEAGALSLRFLHTDPIFLKVPFWFRVGLREPRCRQRACIAALLSPDWIRAIDARDCVSTRSNSAIRTARAHVQPVRRDAGEPSQAPECEEGTRPAVQALITLHTNNGRKRLNSIRLTTSARTTQLLWRRTDRSSVRAAGSTRGPTAMPPLKSRATVVFKTYWKAIRGRNPALSSCLSGRYMGSPKHGCVQYLPVRARARF